MARPNYDRYKTADGRKVCAFNKSAWCLSLARCPITLAHSDAGRPTWERHAHECPYHRERYPFIGDHTPDAQRGQLALPGLDLQPPAKSRKRGGATGWETLHFLDRRNE